MADDLERTIDSIGIAKVLVTLKPDAAAASSSLKADLSGLFARLDDELEDSLIAASYRKAKGRLKTRVRERLAPMRMFPKLGLAIGNLDRGHYSSLRNHAAVKNVELAPQISLIRPVAKLATSTSSPGDSWGLERLSLPQAWSAGHEGKGIIVAHLDTGIVASHPSLKTALHAFAEFDLAGDIMTGAKPNDPDGHGTHTAATIAGRDVGKGRVGAAPSCKLASALVIEGGDVISRVLGGLEWSLEQGATVLSLSLGLRGFTPAFQSVINALRQNDMLPVIAIGNEGPGETRSPGNYHNVLSVGATDKSDRVADFSGSNRFSRPKNPLVPSIVAPGVDIRSANTGMGYREDSGTSMATPLVAGLAAVLRAAAPSANASDIEAAIIASCQRPSTMPLSRANAGVPDALRALAALGVIVSAAPKPSKKTKKKSTTAKKKKKKAKTKKKG